jgi:hypothetical protein
MDRLKVFDRALLGKQIGGNGLIVIADTVYLITGVFFGMMEFQALCRVILFINLFVTCVLYHNFIVSKGNMKFELNTEKIVYYPTTRYRFLLNKYAKTLILLVIQFILTMACLGLGYFGNRGHIEASRIIAGLLLVYVGILLTSGTAILVMHLMPFGIYLSMLLYLPLMLFSIALEKLLNGRLTVFGWNSVIIVSAIVLTILILWMLMLWVGKIIYEKIH